MSAHQRCHSGLVDDVIDITSRSVCERRHRLFDDVMKRVQMTANSRSLDGCLPVSMYSAKVRNIYKFLLIDDVIKLRFSIKYVVFEHVNECSYASTCANMYM